MGEPVQRQSPGIHGAIDRKSTDLLDFSILDVGTFLSFRDPLSGARRDMTPLDCSLDYAAAGLTAQDLLDIQATAYTYEVRIYGHADTATLALLDKRLTESEPARSTHVLINDAQVISPDIMDAWLSDEVFVPM